MRELTCVDAFCGAGGMSIGLAGAGFKVLLGFDNDPRCIDTLRLNTKFIEHPVILEDIKNLTSGALRRAAGLKVGELDLLAGGPPCQGFSTQRTIGGDIDERNLLVGSYGDLILDVLPKFFLMENVPGIEGRRGFGVLQDFLRKIAEAYETDKRLLDAQNFGVPQRRLRVFVIGRRRDLPCGSFPWPQPSSTAAPTVWDVIGHLPPPPADFSDHPDYPGHRADRLSSLNVARICAIDAGQSRIDLPAPLLSPCHQRSADQVGHRNVYGRMSWDQVAPTITARFDSFTRGKFGHPEQNRTISIYEGALLQTFPPTYRFVGSKVEQAKQIGNAVPPTLAKSLGRSLAERLQKQ